MGRQAAKDDDHAARQAALRKKLADSESRLGRPYAAIESGIAAPADSTLKDRIGAVKSERDIAQASLDRRLRKYVPALKSRKRKF
jgi:site-specific DNA recombinase